MISGKELSELLSMLFLGTVYMLMTGCTEKEKPTVSVASNINQQTLCEVKAWEHDTVAAACKPGQKVVYLPSSFGDEQLPVIFAAVNCDLRYGIAMTTGAVTCIYLPIIPVQSSPEKSATPESEK